MTRSLTTACTFVVASVVLWGAAFLGWWPPEPWDVYAFAMLSLGVPVAALAATLAFVARELPKPWGVAVTRSPAAWQSVAAALLSFVHLLSGGALFLAPFQH
jgi:ABC-type polysaccharide/polyol phosphate export permease